MSQDDGDIMSEPGSHLDTLAGEESLITTYRTMKLIRVFEDRVHTEFATGDIPGFVHLYAGEEAVAAGLAAHWRTDDFIESTHRGHGHAIAKGCDPISMMAELFGKATGLNRGKGGSMHIADPSLGMLGANGIVGGGPPLACGAGLSAKIRGTDQVAICFTGDGGSNQGMFLESLNLAAVWNLPVIFVVENNGYAEATSSAFHQSGIDVVKRADGFGLPGVIVDGHDVFAVAEAAGEAIHRARIGAGPSLLECKVNRYYGHYEGDSQTYRAPDEVERIRADRDCIALFRERVLAARLLTEQTLTDVDSEVQNLIDVAVQMARAAPFPDPSELTTDVYVSY